jgi:hypothetical protein
VTETVALDLQVAPGSPSWFRLARLAKLLASLTFVWLGIEGAVGVIAGVLAGSIALIAFGLDSGIEGLASVIVLWRFTGTRTVSPVAERQAQKWVAISYLGHSPMPAGSSQEGSVGMWRGGGRPGMSVSAPFV